MKAIDLTPINDNSEKLLVDLGNERFAVMQITVIELITEPGERIAAPHVQVKAPGFMDVAQACELVGQGTCRPFTGMEQVSR